ncbi:MAG TPA: LysM-like peptidoglycan-binding domain-containing protein, partial [Woeseiaceae bacterium]
MNRRASPLLHDYKETAPETAGKNKRLQWFVVGLGLPLVGLMLMWAFNSPTSESSQSAELADEASAVSVIPLAEASLPALDTELELIELATVRPLPEMKPVSPYSELQFRVRPGDTLDRLFRTHKLDLGNLASIASLPEAGKHLRLLRPGDEFRIEHDGGQLISLYRDLDINNALLVSRGESGFAAEIITRPIEIQKRLAYGR